MSRLVLQSVFLLQISKTRLHKLIMNKNTTSLLTSLLLLGGICSSAAENLFINPDFSQGLSSWIGYQGGPDGNRHTQPDTFVSIDNGKVTITPFAPTGHQLNFYQAFGNRGNLNPSLKNGAKYQFEVDFVASTAPKAKLTVIVYFFDESYNNIKRAALPLIQKPGQTTSVQFIVPEEVAIVFVGVSSMGPGQWPGKNFEGSYTVTNFRLTEVR